MPRNLHSFRCTDELWEALQASAEAQGLGVNALLEQIAADYLDIPRPDSLPDVESISKLIAEAIEPVIARIEAVEQAIASKPSPNRTRQGAYIVREASPMAPTLAKLGHKPESPSQQSSQELLTMGEAHKEAERRGFMGSLATFKRRIKAGDRPAGVLVHPEERAKYPEKSNAARWLSFEPLRRGSGYSD